MTTDAITVEEIFRLLAQEASARSAILHVRWSPAAQLWQFTFEDHISELLLAEHREFEAAAARAVIKAGLQPGNP